ncbi:hypothetical protein MXB_432 [Myxobolus squamalis]|nr:hypothetical protein MXB_432 [Myxobolus squamalis]
MAVKTPAFDSSGLQHVLEHLSLCGSLAYPCRDPFFKMLSRSVSTFMNAITCLFMFLKSDPEHTTYPFTTTNEKDFYNLASVYSDSVFHPLLSPLDFLYLFYNNVRQEGWRLEHQNINDKTSPVVFKGVVFNEMGGAYSSNITLCVHSFLKSVLPMSYPHENGGLPLEIPNLTV